MAGNGAFLIVVRVVRSSRIEISRPRGARSVFSLRIIFSADGAVRRFKSAAITGAENTMPSSMQIGCRYALFMFYWILKKFAMCSTSNIFLTNGARFTSVSSLFDSLRKWLNSTNMAMIDESRLWTFSRFTMMSWAPIPAASLSFVSMVYDSWMVSMARLTVIMISVFMSIENNNHPLSFK